MEFQEKRGMAEMLKMPRDCARSLQLTHNIRYKGAPLKGAFFVWLADYFTTVARGKHPFPHYDLSDPRAGIYSMPISVSMGHGGMPIEDIHSPIRRERNLVAHDRRALGSVDGTEVGYCGFAFLEFDNEALTVSYRDETGRMLLSERWITGDNGAEGEILSCESDLLTLEQPIEELVA